MKVSVQHKTSPLLEVESPCYVPEQMSRKQQQSNKQIPNNRQIHFNLHSSFLLITNQNVMLQGKSTTKIPHFIYNQRKEASLPPPRTIRTFHVVQIGSPQSLRES